MKTKLKRNWLIIFCFIMIYGCSSQSKPFEEKIIVVGRDKTVSIKELNFSITNKGCGRQWVSEDGKPGAERPYCDLLVKHGDSTESFSAGFKIIYTGDLQLKMQRINPWGREEDSVPPGGCRVKIRRSPAFLLVEKNGWTPESLISQTSISIPDTGSTENLLLKLDSEKYGGRDLPKLTIRLKEKGKHSGNNILAHIIMDDEEAISGWISSQGDNPKTARLDISKANIADW